MIAVDITSASLLTMEKSTGKHCIMRDNILHSVHSFMIQMIFYACMKSTVYKYYEA